MPEPTLVGDLNLDAPIPAIMVGQRYARARLLARLHAQPIGEVVAPLERGRLAAEHVAALTWEQLGERIGKHLADDGLGMPSALPVEGLMSGPAPACQGSWRHGAPPITVVIATRDRTESLCRCLGSLAGLDYPQYDVVVVDSAPSTRATEQALRHDARWPYPLRYVRADRPGLARAHNAALPAVTGKITAFTDDDVEVDPHWLSALAGSFADQTVACVTGLILPAELETPAQAWIEQAGGFARGFAERVFGLDDPPPDPLFPFTAGRFGSGANMAFRTDWLRTGGFDPATGAGTPARGGDDLVAFLRVILDGRRLAYQPSAIVRHWHRRDYDGLKRQAFGYGVGLGAYLTATVCAQPSLLPAMLARAAPGAWHLLSAGSQKNSGKRPDFPAELTWRERAGVLVGPLAYAYSRRRSR